MDELKQITELALDIDRVANLGLGISGAIAKDLYDEGYHKNEQGEWKPIMQELNYCDTLECSVCEFVIDISEGDYKYCPNCGAKMKGN